jgi:chaperonin GroEL
MLRRALEEPMRHIGFNAGQDGSVLVEAIRRKAAESNNRNMGYDVISGEFVDMVKAGIIDPAKVTRSALENASSIAGMILTTEALITEIPEKEKAAAPPMPEY